MNRYNVTTRTKDGKPSRRLVVSAADKAAAKEKAQTQITERGLRNETVSVDDIQILGSLPAGKPCTIKVKALMDGKPGFLRERIYHAILGSKSKIILFDFTGVPSYSSSEFYFKTIAETAQELPEFYYEYHFDKPDEKFGTKNEFERIQRLTEKRTVRIAFGTEICHELLRKANETDIRNVILYGNPGLGQVKAIRFRTEAEKKAYLQGVEDALGQQDAFTFQDSFPMHNKASLILPVKPA